MKSIISKGKNIDEAIHAGLEILNASKEMVNVEVMQHETKGFLGIGSKMAIVKITKPSVSSPLDKVINNFIVEMDVLSEGKEEDPDTVNSINLINEQMERIDNDELEGKVWISNGKLYCRTSLERYPTVTIHPNIKLYKNNVLVKEKTTIISEQNTYEMEIENEVKETKWRVSIDKHKLKVHLSIEPGYKIVRSIPDMDAVHHLELKAIEKKEIVNTLNYYKVLQKLTALEIKYGLNRSEILKALETSEPGTFEIAAGMIPTKGKDGWVELKVESEMQEGPKEKEDGSIDFREYRTIPNVERGMVIGILHPPIPGQPGCTVCNEILPAKPVFPVTLRAGKGTTLIDHKIIAKDFGRPLIEKRGRLVQVKVIPKLTCKDNVNLASGNIHFSGDVEVMGEVEKNMIVEAEGNIIIKKTVTNAFLTSFSGGVISYGNIIGSEISVGKNNMLITELGHLLGNIHQNVEKMIAVIKQLTNSQAFKTNDFSRGGLQPLIRILLEKKFINFPPLVKKYVEVVNRGEKFLDDDNWKVIGVSLSQVFLSLTNEVASIDGISHISQQMKELVDFSVTPVEPDSFITIPSVLNSKLYCSGNVLVIGKGCINSKIHAGGLLKISGVLRGGEVYGRLGVDINESGAESGTLTIIAVPSDQTIRIKKVMEGTTIKIGNIKYTFKETRRNIVARLNANDRMVFE